MRPKGVLRTALRPLGLIYGMVARVRAAAYRLGIARLRRLPGVVVSVGNLTVGGTGKTPFAIWLVESLLREGKRPGILTRGYGGLRAGPEKPPGRDADEVALFRARLGDAVPLGVGKNRYAAAQPLIAQGVDWFVLDDGFQHFRLARDVDVVLVDAIDPFGGGLLPAGRAREPRSALSRADILLITRAERAPGLESLLRRLSEAPIFYAQTEFGGLFTVAAGQASEGCHGPFFAFCGIGNAAAFEADLRRWSVQLPGGVAGMRAFSDHHRYTQDEMRALERAAQEAGAAALLCTEKDTFNFPQVLPPLNIPLFYCRIRLQPADPDGLLRAIHAVAARRRGGPR